MRRSQVRTRVKVRTIKSDMDTLKLQIRPTNRWIHSIPKNNTKNGKSNVLLALGSTATALALLLVCYILSSGDSRDLVRYSVVIDAGSTGTRIHIFRHRIEEAKPVLDFGSENYWSMRVNPGLSAYAADPRGAAVSLAELVEFAKGRVPEQRRGETEIRLMATAGMRLLNAPVQERVLEVCRDVLRSSGFRFRDDWASIISGSEEGIYAWVIANHALGSLGGDPVGTVGIIELGGASAQVTFASSEHMSPEFSANVAFGNSTYSLFSHSFLHFGQNAAFDALKELLVSGAFGSASESLQKGVLVDPCTPKGYSHDSSSLKLSKESSGERLSSLQPGGNFSQCRSAALMLLQKGKERCFSQPCSAGATFMPKLKGRFLATENFFYTSKFFGLQRKSSLSALREAGEQYCSEDWSNLKMKHPLFDEDDLLRYCFSSAYIVAFLHDSLGISIDDDRIEFANQVGDIPLDWALGAFVLMANSQMGSHYPVWIYSVFGYDSTKLMYLVGGCVFLVLVAWSISRWRKPQLKTIYDLEKGRYIVTRIR